jgi:hypothetical protein
MYWLITYQWETRDGKTIVDNEVHQGRISEWVLMSLEQPERWRFINAQEISEEEYGDLDGKVG